MSLRLLRTVTLGMECGSGMIMCIANVSWFQCLYSDNIIIEILNCCRIQYLQCAIYKQRNNDVLKLHPRLCFCVAQKQHGNSCMDISHPCKDCASFVETTKPTEFASIIVHYTRSCIHVKFWLNL